MIRYTDYVYSNDPWLFFKFDEPTDTIFYDYSGNYRHLEKLSGDVVCSNIIDSIGTDVLDRDNNIYGIKLDHQYIVGINDKASFFDYPFSVFEKSYIFNPAKYYDSIRAEFIIGNFPRNGSGYNEFLKIGPMHFGIKIVANIVNFYCIICYTDNSVYKIYEKLLYDISNDPLNNFYLISIAYTQLSDTMFNLFFTINGDIIHDDDIEITSNDDIPFFENRQYINIGLDNNITISHLSVYVNNINPTFYYVDKSHLNLITEKMTPGTEITTTQTFNFTDVTTSYYVGLDKNPASLFYILSIALIDGSKQNIIDYISPNTPTTGKATLVLKNVKLNTISIDPMFKCGDKIQITGVEDITDYNGIHTITGTYFNNPIITINNNQPGTGGYILVKKIELGNGIWRTKNNDNFKCFYSENRTYNTVMLAIDDIDDDTAKAKIYYNNSSYSDQVIIRKNYISPYVEKLSKYQIIGDDKRFYLLIGYRIESINFSDIIVYGDLQNEFSYDENDAVYCVLSGYKENYGIISINETLYYNKYIILPTGKLMFYNDKPNNTNNTSFLYANNTTVIKKDGVGSNTATILPIIITQ